MVNVYQQLCPVLFGAGAVKELGAKVNEFGCKKVMVVCDPGVKAAGLTDDALASLEAAGIEYELYSEVLPDAPDNIINEVGLRLQTEGFDMVVGLGGGSAMDSAKAMSVLADKPLPISRHFTTCGGGMNVSGAVKLIMIPTNSGTGSESTPISVVHDMERNVKDTILRFADLAIVDPMLTVSAPPFVTATTGMDALSHAVEAYTSNNTNPKTDLMSLEAIRLIKTQLPVAYADGKNIEARTDLSFASNIAGIAFADASVHIGHCAAHELGVQLECAHGIICSITSPCVIEFAAPAMPLKKMVKLAAALDVAVPEGADSVAIGSLCANAIRELARGLNIPALSTLGSREKCISCAQGAIDNNWFHIMAPREVTLQAMEEFLANMYDNY